MSRARDLSQLITGANNTSRAQPAVRQTVFTASVDQTTGQPNYLTGAVGNAVNLLATNTEVGLTFAAGSQDFITALDADVNNAWTGLVPNNTNFLSTDYVDANHVSFTSTLMPPQYGTSFNSMQYSLMHFEGTNGATNFSDDYGNSWITGAGSPKISTAAYKFGSSSLLVNGTSDYLQSNTILSLPQTWTVEGWVNLNALPASGNTPALFHGVVSGGGYGVMLGVYNNAGTTTFVFYVSSNGTSWDIANAVPGTTHLTTGTWYHVALSFDGSVYRLFLNGNLEAPVYNSGRACSFGRSLIGAFAGTSNGMQYLSAYIDEFRLSPCARYTQDFTAPTGAFTADGDFYNISQGIMYSITGPGPTFTRVKRVYGAEATTNGGSALVHFDGTNGSTSLTDAYGNSFIAMGTASISTAQSVFGGSSLSCNSTSGARGVFTPTLGSTWTIEAWVYFNSFAASTDIFDLRQSVSTAGSLLLRAPASTTGTLTLYLGTNGGTTWDIVSAAAGTKASWATGTWYHIAVSYDGATYRTFVNGTIDYSLASTAHVLAQPQGFYLGVSGNASEGISGYIDEFRLSQQARYTTNFSVPAVPFTADETKVNSLTAYALNGKYMSGRFAISANNSYTKNHNIGTDKVTVLTLGATTVGGPLCDFVKFVSGTSYYGGYVGNVTSKTASLLSAQTACTVMNAPGSEVTAVEAVLVVTRGF